MLFVRDKGRLCNNILQYGHAYAWGREHGRETMSMRFAYKYQYFRICHTRWHWPWLYVVAKLSAAVGLLPKIGFHDVDEQSGQPVAASHAANEQLMLNCRHALVEGWYIRFYDLFIKYKAEILSLFAFDDAIVDAVQTYLQEQSAHDMALSAVKLGVHIRRGDYQTFCNGRYYYTDDEYISMIKAFCLAHDEPVTVYLCTNDTQLDRDYYSRELSGICRVAPMLVGRNNEALDLCLLSECDHIVGPPSTFSLVAAMYHDCPLLWMHTADPALVSDAKAWGYFDEMFRHIV